VDEWAFIDWVKIYLERSGCDERVVTGVGDDMAVVRAGRETLLLGSDMLVEGVHFDLGGTSPEQVGRKALGVCLSDCAAMAGRPLAALVSLSKPRVMSMSVVERVYHGLARMARDFGCTIVGGDTCGGSSQLVIDVSLLGVADGVEPVLRSGAKAGDWLYVTGRLGGSILGRHTDFVPRVQEGRWLAEKLPVHAMIDLSDGLSTDVGHVCRASGVAAEFDEARLVDAASEAARTLADRDGRSVLEHVLNDGEDFELLAAIGAEPEELPELPGNLALRAVGRMVEGEGAWIVRADGNRNALRSGGYKHF